MEEKDLEKLTATKLREIAKQYEGITGVHAMKKEDLIRAIHEARGEPKKLVKKNKKGLTKSIGSIKKEIKTIQEHKQAAQDKKEVLLLRKKIKKHRRLTRKMAKAKA